MLKFQLLVLILCSIHIEKSVGIVGGIKAAQPPPNDPVVFVRRSSKSARVEGLHNLNTGIYSYLGIRYAEPPTGLNRYKRPLYKRLLGDVNATVHGSPCLQPDSYNPRLVVGSEDCLLLNIFSPYIPDGSTKFPVVVWIHGGGGRYGSANQYGPGLFPQRNVILVPIQFRLGTLGNFGDGRKEFGGNMAHFDMAAAIRWVADYIEFFGGDPTNIKVMGHGSGASSAMYLSTSNVASKSLNGVVAMSGSSITPYALDKTPRNSVNKVAQENSCSFGNETEFLKCMNDKNSEAVIENDSKLQDDRLSGEQKMQTLMGSVGFPPLLEVPDDRRGLPGFIVENPTNTLENGKFKKMPLLIGMTKDETGNGILPKELESTWKSLDKFMGSLSNTIGIQLNKFLNLDNITGQIVSKNLLDLGVPKLNDFLRIPPNLSPDQILNKLIDTTTNALFSIPAFLTTNFWGKKAPAFLYRFDHMGKSSTGKKFLTNLPLVTKTETKNVVAHGDELIYLFDLCDLYGKPIQTNPKSVQDLNVQKKFTDLIVDFANFNSENNQQNATNIFSSIKTDSKSFIKIDDNVSVDGDFNLCKLSVWGVDIGKGSVKSCKFLTDALAPITSITGGVVDKLNLGGLTGNNQQSGRTSPVQRPKPQQPQNRGSLLGLGL